MTGAHPDDLAAGMLLVAAPTLLDGNFAGTVVLLLEVNADGALGVVLNRPGTLPVGQVLEAWREVVSEPAVLFEGGPVEKQGALAVTLLNGPWSAGEQAAQPGFREVVGRLGLLDLDTPVELVAGAIGRLRVFAGYAGWGGGQLEREVAEGSWYVVPALPDDIFAGDEERLADLPRRVLARQPGDLAQHSTRPLDPELN